MKTLELRDIEGNLILTTKINVSGDNFVWKPQTGFRIFLGCLSLTEDAVLTSKSSRQEKIGLIDEKKLFRIAPKIFNDCLFGR